MRDLDEATRAELAAKVEKRVAAGMDRSLARRKVWDDYQAELVAIAAGVAGIDERPPPPDLPPAREKGKTYQPKSWYIPRTDSGQDFFTPERMQKSRSELEKLKKRLKAGVKS
ncbi:hypothetical protein EV682_103147 [Iodobacter fluviatilis]|uniref:Uncharacterized protein n=2 Tax=Iodobacter fluviatilis TaxID=537 RepID=A0A377Q7Y1_9NEIS|nr:hypothetical protein EV682_103147 [Iodobacter fluviatilis]STQ91366.1 Uncharacterised protein [Iodobacter fluviatilis]